MRGLWLPTLGQLIGIHDRIIQRTGGDAGILSSGSIDAALQRARWGPFEGDGDLAERGALILRGIVADHPFVDGNKRTGVTILKVFFLMNAVDLHVSDQELVTLALHMAKQDLPLKEITAWIRRKL